MKYLHSRGCFITSLSGALLLLLLLIHNDALIFAKTFNDGGVNIIGIVCPYHSTRYPQSIQISPLSVSGGNTTFWGSDLVLGPRLIGSCLPNLELFLASNNSSKIENLTKYFYGPREFLIGNLLSKS